MRFDSLDDLVAFFSARLPDVRREMRRRYPQGYHGDCGHCASSPMSLAENALLQAKFHKLGKLSDPVACVIYLFSRWNGEQVGGTRIGGRPATQADETWPTDSEGAPLAFLAQFDLRESTNPRVRRNAVLAIYAEEITAFMDSALQFRWVDPDRATLGTMPAPPAEHKPKKPTQPTMRVHDPESAVESAAPTSRPVLPGYQGSPLHAFDYRKSSVTRDDDLWGPQFITIFHGTKLGGVDPIGESVLPTLNWGKPESEHIPALGDYIGSIGSIQAGTPEASPFLEDVGVFTYRFTTREDFILDDIGFISVYLQPNGELLWYSQSG